VVGINELLMTVRQKRDLDIPIQVDGASGGFVWPFLYPESQWDFGLEHVRSPILTLAALVNRPL
jgi:glutamate decarboxylase